MDPALTALQEHFGFPAFRPGQADAVAAVSDSRHPRDVLVVMPTGAGKSLCYQLPALMRDDLTVVVSPLVALMADQVQALGRVAPGRAGLVNAQQDAATNRDIVERAVAGDLRLLYVAPERFSSPGFLEAIERARIGLFVVDEAHCVSQWGHDFRPDYFRLGDAARWLGAAAIVASTATATPQVAADIVVRLGLRDPVRVTTGFDRPNLSFAVVPCATTADKHRRLAAALADPQARPAIVYAGTRMGTVRLADRLSGDLGTEVVAYHAGLGREERAGAQRRFMAGEVEVVVATNAFGMGIDKADVRTVAHESVPASIEAYYQEAGRAGRDGRPARSLLFAEQRDKGLHVFFIQRADVDDAAVARVAERLHARAQPPTAIDGAGGTLGRFDVGIAELAPPDESERVKAIVGHLARAGVLRLAPAPADRVRGRIEAPFDGRARAACRTSAGEGQKARWHQYRSVWSFVEGDRCRRATILRHFGDHSAPKPVVSCCDVCSPELVPAAPTARAAGPRGLDAHGRAGPARSPAPGGAGHPVLVAVDDLDAAIVTVVRDAAPPVGRTRVAEILRGGRSKIVVKYAYDGLPSYGTFDHLTAGRVVDRVDELLATGTLVSTGGGHPKLGLGSGSVAA